MRDAAAIKADLAVCTALLKEGSKSFAAAAMLLPKRVREPATALYAFCRLADDAVDLSDDPAAALVRLNERLDRAYASNPMPHAVDRAFAEVVAQFHIPREVPQALFEGFEWDAHGRTYTTITDVEAYGVRVAGTVGIMMAMIMGAKTPASLARGCDLGVAMQLTNIARDVGEDARNGRLYLPRDWMREAGLDPENFLAKPIFSPALGRVIDRLLQSAASLYRRGNAGVADLPPDCRPAIHAARLIYSEIGREVKLAEFDSVSRRARVSGTRKIALLMQAVAAGMQRAQPRSQPAIASAQPLLSAILAIQPQQPDIDTGIDRKLARAIELLADVDNRQRRIVPRRRGRLGRLAAAE